MSLTVQEMLTLPVLNGAKVIAGEKGMDREVTCVTLGELPQYDLIRKGVVILTSGYLVRDNISEIVNMIEKAHGAGASALGIKLQKYVHEIPLEAVHVANILEFPVFELPKSLLFEDMLSEVQAEIIDKQAKRLEFSEKTLRMFTNKLILGGTIQNVVDNLSGILQKEIAFYDSVFGEHVMSNNKQGHEANRIEVLINTWLMDKKSMPIILESKKYGELIFVDEERGYEPTDFEVIAIEHASTVIELQIQKKISNRQIEKSYLNEFVRDLVTGRIQSIEELRRKGALYNCHFKEKKVVVLAEVDDIKKKFFQSGKDYDSADLQNITGVIFRDVSNSFNMHFRSLLHTDFSELLVMIIDIEKHDYEFMKKIISVSDQVREAIARQYAYTLTIGIGCAIEDPMQMKDSFEKAQKSIALGRKIYGKNKTVDYENLGVFNLLELISEKKEAKKFCREHLSVFITYDQKHDTQLIESLKALVKCDWNLKEASKCMFVHYNTMKYRYKKIVELLHVHVLESEKKLSIAIALKLLEMSE